ncbi:hypothetical protein ACFL27_27865 [candidate division CSSED10-310 bacterium]|uniref:DUF4253 domain-containing protein n=1 Tax=candidate division CSSED10-310 bacterium TaxID=2855610 RepID=A0ABV6Z6E6_UNCC1
MNDIDAILENQALKQEFATLGLGLENVWQPTPDDIELENRQLAHLLEWVRNYDEHRDREKMELLGYTFPPIYPDFDPDADWDRFQRWVMGLPLSFNLREEIAPYIQLQDPAQLSDEQIEQALDNIMKLLPEYNYSIDVNEGIPPRLLYEHVLEFLNEEALFISHGCCHYDGCSGFCPDCFQRPWCEGGGRLCWPEDEELGRMFLIEAVKRYVSATPFSGEILKRCQVEDEHKMTALMDDVDEM